MKRAQSAMEYIMIIGGALVLVALVLILVNYFAANSQSDIQKDNEKIDCLKEKFKDPDFVCPPGSFSPLKILSNPHHSFNNFFH
ncbi:hypothetical protein HUU53_02990 [Candidatus Micrarchaeota archaeon]|nr:hypothetical protein [Candidatus Micrarchaeota archaeon]